MTTKAPQPIARLGRLTPYHRATMRIHEEDDMITELEEAAERWRAARVEEEAAREALAALAVAAVEAGQTKTAVATAAGTTRMTLDKWIRNAG